ncbi:unnamed protein product [Meganyctiphanes norvegica]|uniref:C2H2-type domain-containing protein n=1 Tax=Meganyctiphanes norvegica TaxID=48144 RepID=A0AAV2QMV1_MEGNR
MSVCWIMSLLVIIAVAPFAVAVVTLLQQGDALLAAALMVLFLMSVIAILMKLLKNTTEEQQENSTDQGLSTSLAAAESPPAYDIVIKSPPPYISYPGSTHSSVAHQGAPTSMYYCYCGSNDAAAAATSATPCKPCSALINMPYSIQLHQDTHHSDKTCCSDPFLPTYSEAVRIETYVRGENTIL